jgi:thiamine pyrophosphokinase
VNRRVVIFANGLLPDLSHAKALLQANDVIICADGGTHHALALHLRPDLVIGDMDSISKEEWQQLQRENIAIDLHPRDKDETDLELALDRALDQKPSSIRVIAALGKRLDQTLGNISLLADPRLADQDIRLDDGLDEVLLCRSRSELRGSPGDTVSLIPWAGPARGIRTSGLKWPLEDESLLPEKTRGISNEMTSATASIALTSGLLVIVHRRSD